MIDIILSLLFGASICGVILQFIHQKRIEKIQQNAEEQAKKLFDASLSQAKEQQTIFQEQLHADKQKVDLERAELREKNQRMAELEQKLILREEKIEVRYEEIEKKFGTLRAREEELQKERSNQEQVRQELRDELSKVAKLTTDDAKNLLLKRTEERYEQDILKVIEKKKKDLQIRESEISREILIKSIQQYAGDVTGETTQTLIHLESDDIKGKLIWKEWRNIIAFERATGVSLIIDDTPDTVFISSFDLFRRYIAKKSLEALIVDKRIQPARIEEIVEENQKEAEKLIYDLGQKTLSEMGIVGIPDEIVPLIGKFRFRTSYGQNILMHSKEVAYIAESIARLIGADAALSFKGWLLHDLGKSLDHDIEGTHPEIGGKIARKYGLDEQLVNIIEGHHDGVPQICIETKIVQIADAISAVRPGARRMNADEYVKRIQEMENIAMSFSGVSKAFALSAGREVRVFVDAETVSDLEAEKLAQEIATSIEANLSYPGEVKVNLIREKRIIEYAR
jgi:ribonuclease Y